MRKNREIKMIFILLAVFFTLFLALPMIMVLGQSFTVDGQNGITFSNYAEHVRAVFEDNTLFGVYTNSLMVAVITALAGTLLSYGAALVTARSTVSGKIKSAIESIALVTNTIPGMVIGLAYLFAFTGTSLQNTFAILIICNIVHFFSTPYLMMKNSLSKMNASWETTAMLMGDNWIKTIMRVVTPNAISTLLEVFSYYFVNAMVTVSAVIFLAGARTMVITTKIKELQYFNKYNEIFVLSLLILLTNLIGREELQSYYPNALYNGEETDAANQSANPKVFPEKLTVDLLEKHQQLSEECK